MRILLDECVDRRLRRELAEHDVSTVQEAGWAGMKNGELLTLAAKSFDVFVTVDRNLYFQQNVQKLDIAVAVLTAQTNRLVDLKPLAPALRAQLPDIKKGKVIVISKA